MSRRSGNKKSLLRSFVRTFPPLKVALYVNDLICYLFSKLIDLIKYIVAKSSRLVLYLFELVFLLVKKACIWLLFQLGKIQFIRKLSRKGEYKQLKVVNPGGPIPYANDLIKRLLTYHAGIYLALALYIFVYFVLVKHHTYITIAVALIVLLVYLLLIENSHNFRSILMLSLPVMFTNRGRALIFCSMLALMSSGPINTLQLNVKEIHSSLTCCKQYLIVSSDRNIEENYVKRLVKVEEIVMDLVANIKLYAKELKDKFASIIKLAIECEQYIIDAINRLRDIVNICNTHKHDAVVNCRKAVASMFQKCHLMFNPFRYGMCDLVGRGLNSICDPSKLPDALCRIPVEVVDFIQRTIGVRLKQYIQVIENEFYVDVSIDRQYFYNLTKSKSFEQVAGEIKFDVDQKFWYIHFIARVFYSLSLILVIFILATATIYHMHYLTDLTYDNMYLDQSLIEIDNLRRTRARLEEQRVRSSTQVAKQRVLDEVDFDQDDEPIDKLDQADDTSSEDEENDKDEIGNEPKSIIDEFDPLANDPQDIHQTRRQQGQQDNKRQLSNDDLPFNERFNRVARQELGLDQQEPGSKDEANNNELTIKDRLENETKISLNDTSLFPMTKKHERRYLKPFTLTMNHVEKSKLKWSGLIWLIIIGYIWFFVVLDFAFYNLVKFLVEILRDILFTSDLPLVDLQTVGSNPDGSKKIVSYNRTYLNSLRKQRQLQALSLHSAQAVSLQKDGSKAIGVNTSNSSIEQFYRRLMDSIEHDIPDDVAILESLEECLPKVHEPTYGTYKSLAYLALFTFFGVIIEAYALRTRHYIANLYYPKRARARSVWLYKKMLAEKPKYDYDDNNLTT